MITLMMLETACRAWLELMRDSFSRSSFDSRVRCTSALKFSRFIDSTMPPSLTSESVNLRCYVYLKRLKPFFFSGLGGIPHADRAMSWSTFAMFESSSASGTASFCILRTLK